jgi:hypothetical protein
MGLHGLFPVKHYLHLHSMMSQGGDRSCISAVSESLQRYKYFLLQPIFPDVVEQKNGGGEIQSACVEKLGLCEIEKWAI